MELRHLRYFTAVAEALSFTKAAMQLRLAQPSLSRQVHNLEDELGVLLFDRSNGHVALTAEGCRFLADSKQILAQCDESVVAIRGMSRGASGSFTIGYAANLRYLSLPASLGAFRKLYPKVAVNLLDMTWTEQLESLETRQIDLAFIGLRPTHSAHELLYECLEHETMLAALSDRHPLAKKTKIKLAELDGEFFISRSTTASLGARQWLLDSCKSAGFTAKILRESDSLRHTIKFVTDGLGVALLPDYAADLPHIGVALRPLSPPLRREVTVVWRADNPSKPLQDYLRIVKDLLPAASGRPSWAPISA